MTLYIIRRLSWTAVVVLLVLLLTFAVFYLMPAGDPALRFAGKSPTPESLELVRERLGLNRPWYVQVGKYAQHFGRGDQYGWPRRPRAGAGRPWGGTAGHRGRRAS